MSKKYDIVAVVGEYTNKQGEQKKKYQNVGAIIQGENGPFILLNKTFNPAGLAEPGSESILLSLFEPKPREQQAPVHQAAPADDFDSDIPF